jgi:hypothetical protein
VVNTTLGSEKVYVSGVDSSVVVPASGKVQAGGCWGSGVTVTVGTLVTVGGSGVDVGVTVACGVAVTCEQAARKMSKVKSEVLIFIEVSIGGLSPSRSRLQRDIFQAHCFSISPENDIVMLQA